MLLFTPSGRNLYFREALEIAMNFCIFCATLKSRLRKKCNPGRSATANGDHRKYSLQCHSVRPPLFDSISQSSYDLRKVEVEIGNFGLKS